MTIPSNCHNASGEWVQERQPMADTLRAMGAPMPEFDRYSFVKELYLRDRESPPPSAKKLHWENSTMCSARNQIVAGEITGRWRLVSKNVFASLPPGKRCTNCNKSYLTSR